MLFKTSLGLALGFIFACSGVGCQKASKSENPSAVLTLNKGYSRSQSKVLVREIHTPTQALLDFSAYTKNVMLWNPDWVAVSLAKPIHAESLSFGDLILTARKDLGSTPLSPGEIAKPLAWTPLLEYLLKWNFSKAAGLANAYSAVTSEKWGDSTDQTQSMQEFATVFIHGEKGKREVWAELEFKPGMKPFLQGFDDKDGDTFPEIWVCLNPSLFTQEMIEVALGDYFTRSLSETEVMEWAHQLASRWYPSHNTDMVELQNRSWPYPNTPKAIQDEMAGQVIGNPLFIFRGRPYEDTLYNVFVIPGMGETKSTQRDTVQIPAVEKQVDSRLAENLEMRITGIQAELKEYGTGLWGSWREKTSAFRAQTKSFADSEPTGILGLVGKDRFLVFRRELDYLQAEDLSLAQPGQNPIPVIKAFRDSLAGLGIDFLFVPIPTKLDIYPEKVATQASRLPGSIAQPYFRKALLDLAGAGVETVDLLTPFLESKAAGKDNPPLYQSQDTHWNTHGLELAASLLSQRIQEYDWAGQLFAQAQEFQARDTAFESLGDIQARLSDAQKARTAPEKLLGRQILDQNRNFYRDSDTASILVLGDSYTGVYHSIGCRHAGVTAHLAKNLGNPVDLIMGWGGGPEAPRKLKNRGPGYLDKKRLVIWMMSARDLFVYPGNWSAN